MLFDLITVNPRIKSGTATVPSTVSFERKKRRAALTESPDNATAIRLWDVASDAYQPLPQHPRETADAFQPYSGKHLCPVHFIKDVEAKAKRTIRMHRWLHPKDHIAVALSGDSVSAALLFFLSKLTGNRRDIRLSAITIDPGIAGYKVKEHAGKTTAACDVAWFSGSFAERYGITADEIFRREGRERACRTCEILKKDLIGDLAQEQGITSCAFATTIDDIATSFFTDILFGTVERTFFPSWVIGTNPIPVIRLLLKYRQRK